MTGPKSLQSVKIIIAVITWLLLALVVGKYRLLNIIPPPLPQVVLFGLTFILLLLCWKLSIFRNWVFNVDIRVLVLVHLSRFIGIYFLILHSQGELPYAFAVPGGLGDIAVATTAIFVSLIFSTSGVKGLKVILIWNVFGLLDILFVIATAVRLVMADPGSMSALTELPLSVLPTFLVPIIIFTHIIIFVRLIKFHSEL